MILEDERNKRKDKITKGLELVGKRDVANNVKTLWDLIKDSVFEDHLVKSISFSNNSDTSLRGREQRSNNRQIARLVIFLTNFNHGLGLPQNTTLKVLSNFTPKARLSCGGVALPGAGDSNDFNAYVDTNASQLVGWATRLADEFRTNYPDWFQVYDPTALSAAEDRNKQILENEKTAYQLKIFEEAISDLVRRVRELEKITELIKTELRKLKTSQNQFKLDAKAHFDQISLQVRSLQVTVDQHTRQIDFNRKVFQNQVQALSSKVAGAVKEVIKVRADYITVSGRVTKVEKTNEGQDLLIAKNADDISKLRLQTNNLTRDFLEQSRLVAETNAACCLTMAVTTLMAQLTEKIHAASFKLEALGKAEKTARTRYNEMLTGASAKEEMLLDALSMILYAAELATPLPFNTIVRIMRTNVKYAVGVPKTVLPPAESKEEGDAPEGDKPEAEDGSDTDSSDEDGAGSQKDDNPDFTRKLKEIIPALRDGAESEALSRTDGITSPLLKGMIEEQLVGGLDAAQEKAEGLVAKFMKTPLIEVGWKVDDGRTFEDVLKKARDQAVLKLSKKIQEACEGMLNMKKVRAAIQAAYWAEGEEPQVGGISARDVSTRVVDHITSKFDNVWVTWENGIDSVLGTDANRFEQGAVEAFLALSIGTFVENNFGGAKKLTLPNTVNALPDKLVEWLIQIDVVRRDDSVKSANAYNQKFIPWRTSSRKSNSNHALMVWAVFRKFSDSESDFLKNLFISGTNGTPAVLKGLITEVGLALERTKERTTMGGMFGKKRVNTSKLIALFPKASAGDLSGMDSETEDD